MRDGAIHLADGVQREEEVWLARQLLLDELRDTLVQRNPPIRTVQIEKLAEEVLVLCRVIKGLAYEAPG